MTGVRPLPRSLDPLAGESLNGYLLRLAHRLDLSPARVAVLTGLTDPRLSKIPASRLLDLTPDHTAAFARATHLSTAEVTVLTLISLADRYPPVNPTFSGRHRQNHGIFVKENWVFSRSSRYCPDCLAGDGRQPDPRPARRSLETHLAAARRVRLPAPPTPAPPHLPRLQPASPPTTAPPARPNC